MFIYKLVKYMREAPRIIPIALDYLFIAKAIERMGDHATNIAELIIYIVEGTDVRHISGKQLEQEAMQHEVHGERSGREFDTDKRDR
ncbi:phosphate uptake regulator [Paraburkholderia sp. WC7.3d]